MRRPLRATRLFLANRSTVLLCILGPLAYSLAFGLVGFLILGAIVGYPVPPEAATGLANTATVVVAVPSVLVPVGVLAVNRDFALALAFGSSRRDFWLGTFLAFAAVSVATGLGAVLLLFVERWTGHWWIGLRAFDTATAGSGDPVVLFAIVVLLAMLGLALGSLFGTLFRAFGTVVTAVTAVVMGVCALAAGLVVVASRDTLLPAFAASGWLGPLAVGLVLVVVVSAGSFVANRLATY